jgi:sterol desaturase/sphingolipid hydroxylase (fatty acid hydroxylase superfamily)
MMEQFLSYFEDLPIIYKALWILFCITLFWVLEGYFSLFRLQYKKWKHARTNFIFLFFVVLINTVFGIIAAAVFIWGEQTGFGLLNYISAPVWVELLISIIVLDLIAQFFVHYLLHKVKWMWRLHIVHHSDKNVDVTSGTRHHPFDFIIRESFALVSVIILGMPVSFYVFYRIITVLFTYFNHANIRLPLWLDKGLSYIIVSPNMHKFHHHYQLPWTDSNYGNILSVWDRMFGTFVYKDLNDIQYGVDIADHISDENILVQLGIPFNKSVRSKRN